MICRHCKRVNLYERKGLCATCYRDASIAPKYAPRPSLSYRGVGLRNHARDLPEPTEALPGTEGKILVMIARAAADEALWHPADATYSKGRYGDAT